jgi:hypothetical protein
MTDHQDRAPGFRGIPPAPQPANLADVLDRILDKGIVIAGDIQVNLLDIELLTIKLRLLVASVDRAREMGIDWWEGDPSLYSKARARESVEGEERVALEQRLDRIERLLTERFPEGARPLERGDSDA